MLGGTAFRTDFTREPLGHVARPMGVDDDVQARARQLAADRGAERARAAGDQRPPHGTLNTMVPRPASSRSPVSDAIRKS